MKILVTGFDPFGEEKTNPALQAVEQLPSTIAGAMIIPLVVPTVFGKAAEVVEAAIAKHLPDVVINIGQAGGRTALTPERVAINLDDARIADNEGNQPIDAVIQPEGAAAYFTQLPIKAIVKAVREAGYPASISNTAGTFVCNHLMYQVQYLIATKYPQMQGGFIHIPFTPNQVVDKPQYASMNLQDTIAALEVALATVVQYHQRADVQTIEGTLH